MDRRTPLGQASQLTRAGDASPKSSNATPRPKRAGLGLQLQNVAQPVVEIFQSRKSLDSPKEKSTPVLVRRASSPSRIHSPYKLSEHRRSKTQKKPSPPTERAKTILRSSKLKKVTASPSPTSEMNKDLTFVKEEQPAPAPPPAPLSPLKMLACTRHQSPPRRPPTGPPRRTTQPVHQSFRSIHSSFIGQQGPRQGPFWSPTATSSFLNTQKSSVTRPITGLYETYRNSEKLSTPVSEEQRISGSAGLGGGGGGVNVSCLVEEPVLYEELPRQVYTFTGKVHKRAKRSKKQEDAKGQERIKEREQQIIGCGVSSGEDGGGGSSPRAQLELLLQSPLALRTGLLSNCESLQFIRELEGSKAPTQLSISDIDHKPQGQQGWLKRNMSSRGVKRNSSSGLLQSSPSAPLSRVNRQFSGHTATGSESFTTLRRNVENEREELDQKIKFLDLLLDAERRGSVAVLARTPQIRKDVQRYQQAKAEFVRALDHLTPASAASKKPSGVPRGQQTSLHYSEAEEQERRNEHQLVGVVARRGGRFTDSFHKPVKVLKTTEARFPAPGEPPIQLRRSPSPRTPPPPPPPVHHTLLNEAKPLLTLSTPRELFATDPVVVPGVPDERRGSVQSTARFTEGGMIDTSQTIRPPTATGMHASQHTFMPKESAGSLLGDKQLKFETKFSKLARQSAQKFYKPGNSKFKHLAHKKQDITLNSTGADQNMTLQFETLQDLRQFFASPEGYFKEKSRQKQKKAGTDSTCQIVSGRPLSPNSECKSPYRRPSVHMPQAIPLSLTLSGNNTFWGSADISHLKDETGRPLSSGTGRAQTSGQRYQRLKGLLSNAHLQPSRPPTSPVKMPRRATSMGLQGGSGGGGERQVTTQVPFSSPSGSSLPQAEDTLSIRQAESHFSSDKLTLSNRRPHSEIPPPRALSKEPLRKISAMTPPLGDYNFSPRSSSLTGRAGEKELIDVVQFQTMEAIPIKDGTQFFSPTAGSGAGGGGATGGQSSKSRRNTDGPVRMGVRGKTTSDLNRNDSSSTSEFPHLFHRRYETHRRLGFEFESPEELSSVRTQHAPPSDVSIIAAEGILSQSQALMIPGLGKIRPTPLMASNPLPTQLFPKTRDSKGLMTNSRPQTAKRPPIPFQVRLKFSGHVPQGADSGGDALRASMESIGKQIKLEKSRPRTISRQSYFAAAAKNPLISSSPDTLMITPMPEASQPIDTQVMVSPKPEITTTSTPASPEPPPRQIPISRQSTRTAHLRNLKSLSRAERARKEKRAAAKIQENLFSTQQLSHGEVRLTAAPKQRVSLAPQRNSDLDFSQFPLQPYRNRIEKEESLSALKKEKTLAYSRKLRKPQDVFSLADYERSFELRAARAKK